MKLTKTEIEGLYVVYPQIYGDERGWFMESWNENKLVENGLIIKFIQDNHSFTENKYTLRGLHIQKPPYSQTKLVRVTRGRVLDVVVDLRKESKTFLNVFTVQLSSVNKKQLLIPKGLAHGFITQSNNVEFQYKVDEYYNRDSEVTIAFNDPLLKINWGCENPFLSEKDKKGIRVSELI